MVEKEERRGDGLSEEDVGLQLPRMGPSNRTARSWQEMSVDELPDFEGKTEQRGEIKGKGWPGRSDW